MQMHATYNAGALNRLSERVQYEMWLLEAVYAIVEQELFPVWPDAVIYPADGSTAQIYVYGRANTVIGDWRPGFLNVGAPLVFVSIFKLLDMLIEWVLDENGRPSTFRFQEKLRHLECCPVFPPSIESRPWLKERLIGLYRTIEPLRGTIIHNKHFTATDGAIRVSSSRKGMLGAVVEINADRLRKLAVVIVSVVKYTVSAWRLDEHREKILRYGLDELATLHGFHTLSQRSPFRICVRVYSNGSDPFDIDPRTICDELSTRYPNEDCSFDLRIIMVKGGKAVAAYLFPWTLIATGSSSWGRGLDRQRFRTEIPNDIRPEHLGTGTV